MPTRILKPAVRTAMALAIALPVCAHAVNPLDWVVDKVRGKPEAKTETPADAPSPKAEDLRDRGPVAIKPGEPARFVIGEESPAAELPKGHSHFRRVEIEGNVPKAHVRVTVLAQDARSGKGHDVFKPLLYVLDDEGNVKNTVEFDNLELDIRPFKKTRLNGCLVAEGLQRFLVATAEKSVGTNYVSEVRDAVKAPTQSGFFYSTSEPLKVKLPYADTGELILNVLPADKDKAPCGKPAEKKDGDKKDPAAPAK